MAVKRPERKTAAKNIYIALYRQAICKIMVFSNVCFYSAQDPQRAAVL
jgi:hypothetical protein